MYLTNQTATDTDLLEQTLIPPFASMLLQLFRYRGINYTADISGNATDYNASDFTLDAINLRDGYPGDTTTNISGSLTTGGSGHDFSLAVLMDLGSSPSEAITSFSYRVPSWTTGITARYRLYSSSNGTTWTARSSIGILHPADTTTLDTTSNNNKIVSITPVTARYWQFVATWENQSGTAKTVFLSDLRFYTSTGLVLAASVPGPPTGITVVGGLDNRVSISWANGYGNPAITSANVKRSLTLGGTYTNLTAGTGIIGNSFVDLTAVNGTQYFYKVSSINSVGEGPASNPSLGVTPGIPVIPPSTSLTASQSGSHVNLSWTEPAGTYSGTNVYQSVGGGKYYRLNSTLIPWGTTTFQDYSIANGTQYNYFVETVDLTARDISVASNIATVTTAAVGALNTMLIGKTLRGFQFGLESLSTPGTSVAANRLIKNGVFSSNRQNNVKTVKSEGHKSNIGQQRGKRWAEWNITGQIDYNCLPYWASMVILGSVTPTTVGTLGKKWIYPMSSSTVQQPQTMTFEYGNAQGSNSRCAWGTATDLSFKINGSTADYTISGFSSYPTKNITMTTTPTVIAPVFANMTDFRFNYATAFSGLAAGKLLTAKDLELSIKGKYAYQFFIDDATASIGGILEKQPDVSGKLVVAEGTESDYFLGDLEASTPFYMQLQGTGPMIETGSPNVYYSFKYTLAAYVTNEDETDDEDLFAGSYDFTSAEDLTNGDLTMECINTMATL